jgi:hypothetical protein
MENLLRIEREWERHRQVGAQLHELRTERDQLLVRVRELDEQIDALLQE